MDAEEAARIINGEKPVPLSSPDQWERARARLALIRRELDQVQGFLSEMEQTKIEFLAKEKE